MGVFVFIALFCVLGWISLSTVRALRRHHVGMAWWIFLCSFLLAGIAIGIWAGFMLEYPVSPTLRFAGFPFPMAIFQLESGTWVDFVHEKSLMILIGLVDVTVVALSAVIPVSAVFYVYRFLHSRNSGARA